MRSRLVVISTGITTVLLFLSSFVHAQLLQDATGRATWNSDSLGNHRIILSVSAAAIVRNKQIVRAVIPWRRRDIHPEEKRLILSTIDGKKVNNITTRQLTAASVTLYFEPIGGAGDYYLYYMPYKNEGRSNYPKGIYLHADTTAAVSWMNKITTASAGTATAVAYQAIDAFNSFYPMEMIATREETQRLLRSTQERYLVFTEDRLHPIRMKDHIPARWLARKQSGAFIDTAAKGEWLAFQIALLPKDSLQHVQLSFSELSSGKATIGADRFTCINLSGVDYKGAPFQNEINISKQTVQALWCGVDVPADARPGVYKGSITISALGAPPAKIPFTLIVTNKSIANSSIDEPMKQTRLKWLNSTLAQENTVIAPYTPLLVDDTVISLLGRKVMLARDGFPAQIQSYFTPEMTAIGDSATPLFLEPLHFHFYDAAGKQPLKWQKGGIHFTEKNAGTVKWESTSTSSALQMKVSGTLEFDGFLSYQVALTATQDMDFSEITFHLPIMPPVARYIMGLGLKGGLRPDSVLWKWDVAHKNQDGAWIGDVNAGLQFSFRDENYTRPLNTNFYLQKPLVLPSSWGNGNKGGIDVFLKGKSVLVNAYSGSRHVKKGDVLYYNMNLLITPFHPINTDFQWQTRFFHSYQPIDSIKATGATVVNIHHATAINPWINYPFIEYKKMKAYIDEAHSQGLKVKIYNTIRELSNHAYETFALRSLGHEIYSPGKGGGYSWLQEHIGSDYIAAWFVPEIKDAAIVNSGMSRWHNYYVEGMNWLVKNVGIDGIYLDDVAFDRVTMKRIKRVLTQGDHPGIIDLHSANQYNKSDGFNNSANLYMEHFPYLNRLWFGEYFDYENNGPDFFLTEVSGIPFGLMGEMLQNGGNAWRGMIYGMTNRMPWSDNADPRPLWKVWDDFGMTGSSMIGYWSKNCPVTTNSPQVLATVYQKKNAALVAIASWANEDRSIQLIIDWKKLGLDPSKVKIIAPAIANFQEAHSFTADEPIPVKKGKGWLLELVE